MEPQYNINLNFGCFTINYGPTPGGETNLGHVSKHRDKSGRPRDDSQSVLKPSQIVEKQYEFVCPYLRHQKCYFTNKLQLRKHLQWYHGEDIITSNIEEMKSLETEIGKDKALPDQRLRQAKRKLDPHWHGWSWWTCANCLTKMNVETEGWLCINACERIDHPNKDESSVDVEQWIAERRMDPRWLTWDAWTCIRCLGAIFSSEGWQCKTCLPSS